VRIHLFTSGSDQPIPFNYQPMLTGALHKWVGENNIHDDVSLYSFSWLLGGTAMKSGLNFKEGARFFISAYDVDILKRIVKGVQDEPGINHGLKVKEVVIQKEPKFGNEFVFYAASPVFIKRTREDREVHYTYMDSESDECLTETFKNKLRKAGLSDENIFVGFNRSYPNPKTKVIYYNQIGNRVNLCPVIIKGTPEQLAFAWNVGVGNSTGIGFGALR